jgi:hypothetical protein
MKMFLRFCAVSLLCSAFLDPLWASGLGKPIYWFRDFAMAAAGVACLFILVRYRNNL